MSASTINYKQAAGMAALAIATGPALPTGILSALGTLAYATLINIGFDFISSYFQETISKQQEEEILKKSIKNVCAFKSYKWHMKIKKVNSEEELNYWKQNINFEKNSILPWQKKWLPEELERAILLQVIENLRGTIYIKEVFVDSKFYCKKWKSELIEEENQIKINDFSRRKKQVERTSKQFLRGHNSKSYEMQIKSFAQQDLQKINAEEFAFLNSFIVQQHCTPKLSYKEYTSKKIAKYQEEKKRLNSFNLPSIPYPKANQSERHASEYKVSPRLHESETNKYINAAINITKSLKSYRRFLKSYNINSENEFEHWSQVIHKGTCAGQASVLLAKLKKDPNLSLRDSLSLITPKEIIFEQIMETIRVNLFCKIQAHDHTIKKFSKKSKEIASHFSDKKQKCLEEQTRLNALFPRPMPMTLSDDRNRFHAFSNSYQKHLEDAIEAQSLQNEQVKGTINLPNHVLTFEYGPRGYFIYDPYAEATGGLFEYPSEQKFFAGASTLARSYMLDHDDIKVDDYLVAFQVCPTD